MTADETQRQLQQTLQRIEEMCGQVPEPLKACAVSPVFLQDIYFNFKRYVWTDGYLTPKMKASIALAVSLHMRSEPWAVYFADRMRQLGSTVDEANEIAAVVATCSAYNTFYTFKEFSASLNDAKPGLRGHSLQTHHLDMRLTELIAIVVSTLNGCETCTRGHIVEAVNRGVNADHMVEAIQCAATVRAGCTFIA